ncbi:hypothetical protein ACIA8O_31400 [Kitasatospora sp. NPDC051853]|uniref:hypothetical protein n=1 Tax=Kitasatospora sp. NPDC051853 TaxID=3364058 RepID=UPI0037A2F598
MTELDQPLGTHLAHELAHTAGMFATAARHHRSYPGLDDPDLVEVAAAVRQAADRLAEALEDLAHLAAPGQDEETGAWHRARHSALGLRDHLAGLVPASYENERLDDGLGEVARFTELRKARFRTYPR